MIFLLKQRTFVKQKHDFLLKQRTFSRKEVFFCKKQAGRCLESGQFTLKQESLP
jgi:hypothetical protein